MSPLKKVYESIGLQLIHWLTEFYWQLQECLGRVLFFPLESYPSCCSFFCSDMAWKIQKTYKHLQPLGAQKHREKWRVSDKTASED